VSTAIVATDQGTLWEAGWWMLHPARGQDERSRGGRLADLPARAGPPPWRSAFGQSRVTALNDWGLPQWRGDAAKWRLAAAILFH